MGEGALGVPPLPVTASNEEREARYELVLESVKSVLEGAYSNGAKHPELATTPLA